MDGGAWWATVHGVTKSWKRLSDFTFTFHFHAGNPLQCSCLEDPRDGGAWWAAVYGVAQSRTRLKRLSSSSSRHKPLQPEALLMIFHPAVGQKQTWILSSLYNLVTMTKILKSKEASTWLNNLFQACILMIWKPAIWLDPSLAPVCLEFIRPRKVASQDR